jgi:catechol 2,3-dioxygenase-like lactoylglutathione lyase family enzyme
MHSALRIKKFAIYIVLFLLTSHSIVAQQVERPAIWGIAKMTFLVSDFQVARDYYGKFLGFDEAFSYPSNLGKVISFKVNDRQFLEFVQDSQAKEKKRLVSVSFETENPEQMRQYLQSQKVMVPEKTGIDGAGNEVFVVDDPSGNHIEFINLKTNGLHRKSKGKFLSDRRISKRIHHAGLYAEKIMDNDPFYAGALKFTEIVRYPEDRNVSPTILYLGMGDCLENVEHYSPNDQNVSHPCFLVDDMQETIYTLKERKGNEKLGKPGIGKGKRWIMNMYNSDKTRVEFTEAHCVK